MQAVQKRHSTFQEALNIAWQCQAACTVLTHFSQRYPKLLPDLALDPSSNTMVAHDGLRLDLSARVDCRAVQAGVQLALQDEPDDLYDEEIQLSDSS